MDTQIYLFRIVHKIKHILLSCYAHTFLHFHNPLTPESNWHLISPYNITP